MFQYPEDLRPLDEALDDIQRFHWIIFSSSNGILFVDKRLREKGSSLRECSKNTKIAVVGQKTAETLNDLQIKVDFVPPDFIAESLIENFPVSGYGLEIFLPRVQTGGRSKIAEEFRNAGARVVEVSAYESSCPESIPDETINAIQKKEISAIIFSSGKTVKNVSHLLRSEFGQNWLSIIDDVKLLTIGPQTSLICQEIFGRVDKQASIYTFDGILEAAIQIF